MLDSLFLERYKYLTTQIVSKVTQCNTYLNNIKNNIKAFPLNLVGWNIRYFGTHIFNGQVIT